MSGAANRRAEARREARARRRHHDRGHQVATRSAVASPDMVEEAKRQTHDLLIADLGSARRSGVWWWVVGPENPERFVMLEQLVGAGVDRDEMRRLMEEGDTLVCAAAWGQR